MLACPQCDLLHRGDPPAPGSMQVCTRCGAVLGRAGSLGLEAVLALHVAALILLLLALAFPLLSLRMHGTLRVASIPECARILASLGWPWLSAILLTTVILGPVVQLGGTALLLLQILRRRQATWNARMYRVLEEIQRWNMVEVFVLGVTVSYVKLSQNATVFPGPALYALGGCIVVTAVAVATLEPRTIWDSGGPGDAGGPAALPAGDTGPLSARQAELQACATCGRLAAIAVQGPCPRCGASLHSRKPDSQGRTWALLVTSAILYLPANALPVTRVLNLGKPQEDTILSGILYFLRTGSWPLALLIFVASVLVPLVKFVVLTFLLLSVRYRSRWRPLQRARLYRLTDAVGRWSMVDIFAITITVAMMQMGSMASVVPRPGAMAFALMVVATLLAARSFDPRLVWDTQEPEHA
jgi:paraquat-inducible protein A